MKRSYKTLEFWLIVLAVVADLLIASGVFPVDGEAMKIAVMVVNTLGALGYTGFRTKQKQNEALASIAKKKLDANPPR